MPGQNWRKMYRLLVMTLAICAFFLQISFAAKLPGKVVEVLDNTITIRLNESWVPDKGDRITFSRDHQVLGLISIGEGIVLEIGQAPIIFVKRTKGEGEITVGTDAIVHSQSTKRVAEKEETIRHPDPIKSHHDESLIKAVMGNDIHAVKKAITLGATVDAALRTSTPLMIASESGNLPMVEVLLDSGADPNIESRKWGTTALKHAARWGHIKIIDVLLNKGVDINYRGSNIKGIHLAGAPAISYAADSGQGAMVTHLVAKGANPNLENFMGMTPLFYAASEGKIESVNALLNAGVLFDQASSSGFTPLMAAAQADGHWELAAYLLGAGADPDQQIQKVGKEVRPEFLGMTALMISVLVGDEELFFTILLSGADPTIQRADGKMALDLATESLKNIKPDDNDYETLEMIQRSLIQPDWGKKKAMKVIADELEEEIERNNFVIVAAGLRLGVDPNVLVDGEQLFFEALNEGNLSMVKLMLEHGADPNVKNEEGVTAFHATLILGNLEVTRLLLAHGADPNVKNEEGVTAFYATLILGNLEVTRLLLAHGADPNILPPEEDEAPLSYFAGDGNLDVVQLLLSAGMYVDIRDEDQDTPLHKAAQGGYVEIFKILLEAGADPSLKNDDGDRPIDLVRDSKKRPQFLALLPRMTPGNPPVRLKPLTRQEQISEASGSKTDEFDLGDLDF